MEQAEIDAAKALADKDGRITPEAVVGAARDPAHPLHPRFEWDDSVAAERFRIAQARAIIRDITFEVTYENRVYNVPYFVRDPEAASEGQQGYRAIASLSADRATSLRAVQAEFAAAAASLRRARSIAGALGFAKQIDALVGQVIGLATRIAKRRRGPKTRGATAN